jgi:hypothetical protein
MLELPKDPMDTEPPYPVFGDLYPGDPLDVPAMEAALKMTLDQLGLSEEVLSQEPYIPTYVPNLAANPVQHVYDELKMAWECDSDPANTLFPPSPKIRELPRLHPMYEPDGYGNPLWTETQQVDLGTLTGSDLDSHLFTAEDIANVLSEVIQPYQSFAEPGRGTFSTSGYHYPQDNVLPFAFQEQQPTTLFPTNYHDPGLIEWSNPPYCFATSQRSSTEAKLETLLSPPPPASVSAEPESSSNSWLDATIGYLQGLVSKYTTSIDPESMLQYLA